MATDCPANSTAQQIDLDRYDPDELSGAIQRGLISIDFSDHVPAIPITLVIHHTEMLFAAYGPR